MFFFLSIAFSFSLSISFVLSCPSPLFPVSAFLSMILIPSLYCSSVFVLCCFVYRAWVSVYNCKICQVFGLKLKWKRCLKATATAHTNGLTTIHHKEQCAHYFIGVCVCVSVSVKFLGVPITYSLILFFSTVFHSSSFEQWMKMESESNTHTHSLTQWNKWGKKNRNKSPIT